MKELLFAIVLFSITGCRAETSQQSKLIKSEKIIEYTLSGNKKGERRSEQGYSNDRLNYYDKHGNLVESYVPEPEAKHVLISRYSYNSSHNIEKEEEYSENGLLSVTEYTYDKQNRITKTEYKIKSNSAGLKSTLEKYNYQSGPLRYTINYSEYEDAVKEYILSYTVYVKTGEQGNVTEKLYKGAGGKEYYRKEYNKYNKMNKLMEAIVEESNEMTTVIQYTYNSRNDVEKESTSAGSYKQEIKYVYTYDNFGNWVTKAMVTGDKDRDTYTERTINYY
jgi:hypothetical protein